MEIKTKIVSVANQKGGVGKTTTTANLGYSLKELDQKVLLIDLDSQGNLSDTLYPGQQPAEKTSYEILTGQANLKETIKESRIKGIDIIPAKEDLSNVDIQTKPMENRAILLQQAIEEVRPELEYSYILLDCPASLSIITVNAFNISDSVIVPTGTGIYSTDGLDQLMGTVKKVIDNFNPKLYIEGILLTEVDRRTNIAGEFEDKLRDRFGENIFNTVISRNVAVKKAQREQLPVYLYDKQARASKQYIELAKELIDNDR